MDLKAKLQDSLINSSFGTVNNELKQSIIQRSFLWTWIITTIVFLVAYYIVWMLKWWLVNPHQYMIAFWVSMIIGFWLVIAITWGYQKMKYPTLAILSILFALAEWVWLAGILSIYNAASIINAFAWAALLFLIMGVYWYITKTDLTKFWTILFVGLITLVILELINLFLYSSWLSMVLSWLWVLLFMWLTAWDLQTLKAMSETWDKRLELVFWISLYLDFINIFIMLLNLLWSNN